MVRLPDGLSIKNADTFSRVSKFTQMKDNLIILDFIAPFFVIPKINTVITAEAFDS